MRVIETFVTSVPREKIPADAKWFMQDGDDGLLKCSIGEYEKRCSREPFYWYRHGDEDRDYKFDCHEVSTDAAETVVTREELMRAYDLVEQGYTLWFGGECPVECGAIVDVVFRGKKRGEASDVGEFYRWSSRGVDTDIIAYRLSRSVDTSVANARDAAPLVELDHADTIITTAIEARLTNWESDKWPGKSDNFCMKLSDGTGSWDADDIVIITRAQWDDYVSRKIRVGDKVRTQRGAEVEVLFVTAKNAAVRYKIGEELMLPLVSLTRLSQ